MSGRTGRTGFTLLELLASVVLLVMLGAMLFEVFSSSSEVVRLGNARVEIYQYARALFEALHRETQGAITTTAAKPGEGARAFRVFHSENQMGQFSEPVRSGTDAIELCAGLMGRDAIEGSPTYGQSANAAVVAYWVSPEEDSLNRYESYDMNRRDKGLGWEFALNVLDFDIRCQDPWGEETAFKAMDWDSLDEVKPGVRRGLPRAIMVTIRMTDERHIGMYENDSSSGGMRLREEFDPLDDPLAQTFVQIIPILTEQ